MSRLFHGYTKHYLRMNQNLPDWETAEKNPEKFALKKPWLPLNKNAKILDVGCGLGRQLLALWCSGYRNLEGIDISQAQVDLAQKLCSGRINIYHADAQSFLKRRPQAYDLILLYDVIEHFPIDEALNLLHILYNSLRNGGILVIKTPNMANIFASYSRYLDLTHVIGYTEFSLIYLLDQIGFENHGLVLPDYSFKWRRWSFANPLKVFRIRKRMNIMLHKFLYWLRGGTKPSCFASNIELYTYKK